MTSKFALLRRRSPRHAGPIPDFHHYLAREAVAMHQLNLALARWRTGLTQADWLAAEAVLPSPQSRWYTEQQRRFGAWLEAGGFAAPAVEAPAQLKTAALRRCSQPHCGTIYEESKFSLLRIDDAVE